MIQVAEIKAGANSGPPKFMPTKFHSPEEWSEVFTAWWGGRMKRIPEHDQPGALAFQYFEGRGGPRTFLVADPEAPHPNVFDGLHGV